MQIYIAGLHDLDILQSISRETFFDTFSEQNSPEDLQIFLDQQFSLPKLESELKNPGSTFYFLRDGGGIKGYLKLNRGDAQTEQIADGAIEIERIYVRKKDQGYGYGKALLDKAMQVAIEEYAPVIWLGVWEKNLPAISFYKKHGFTVFGEHIFMVGTDPQTDLLMKRGIEGINPKK